MTVKVSKPILNIREKLSELDKPTGVKGNELLRSDTAQDARNLIGAGRKNKFINGAMRISQRGSSISTSTDTDYTLDRIQHIVRGTHDSTYTHSTDHPDGFTESLKISPNGTHTPTGSDNASFQSFIEGQDLQDLQWGTSNPKSFTVSFYAKSGSSNNGHQYTFQIRSYKTNGDTNIKNFPFVVTTTWQRFSFVFTGDGNGDIADTSGNGFACLWNLDAGPDDITSQYTEWTTLNKFQCVTGQSHFQNNTSNEFYLTGVQLEVGDEATEFEHLPYSEDLARCQRYCWVTSYVSQAFIANGTSWNSDSVGGVIHLPVPMRGDPQMTVSSGNDFESTMVFSNTDTLSGGLLRPYSSAPPYQQVGWRGINSGAFTTGQGVILRFKDGQTGGKITVHAEL